MTYVHCNNENGNLTVDDSALVNIVKTMNNEIQGMKKEIEQLKKENTNLNEQVKKLKNVIVQLNSIDDQVKDLKVEKKELEQKKEKNTQQIKKIEQSNVNLIKCNRCGKEIPATELFNHMQTHENDTTVTMQHIKPILPIQPISNKQQENQNIPLSKSEQKPLDAPVIPVVRVSPVHEIKPIVPEKPVEESIKPIVPEPMKPVVPAKKEEEPINPVVPEPMKPIVPEVKPVVKEPAKPVEEQKKPAEQAVPVQNPPQQPIFQPMPPVQGGQIIFPQLQQQSMYPPQNGYYGMQYQQPMNNEQYVPMQGPYYPPPPYNGYAPTHAPANPPPYNFVYQEEVQQQQRDINAPYSPPQIPQQNMMEEQHKPQVPEKIEEELVQCPICMKQFPKNEIERHTNSHFKDSDKPKEPDFLCPMCNTDCKNKKNLTSHMMKHHPELFN